MNSKDLISALANDELIFHFTKREIAIEHILDKQELQFSPLSQSNDPYEYIVKTTLGTIRHPGEIDYQAAKDKPLEYGKFINNFCKVLCFSESQKKINTSNSLTWPYTKPRHWAQYPGPSWGACWGWHGVPYNLRPVAGR